MIALIIKYWRIIVDVAIVVALCVAFSYFDPFHLFRKTELQSTANLISNIREIGELVTAEYYGEVLTDSDLSTVEDANYYLDLEKDFRADLIEELSFLLTQENKTKIEVHHLDDLEKRYNEYWYLITHRLIKDLKRNGKINAIERAKDKFRKGKYADNQNSFINLLNGAIKKGRNNDERMRRVNDFINYNKGQSFQDLYMDLSVIRHTSKKDKEKIIIIARGGVKAGYKFASLDETNLLYNRKQNVIRLYDFNPQILDTIINPWFIPELEIPGYVFVNNPKNSKYSEVIEVKKKCSKELVHQAKKAGIIQQAHVYGKEVLEQFFRTLTNEPELQVIFEETPHKELLKNIVENDTIDQAEVQIIIDLVNEYDASLKQEWGENKDFLLSQKKIIIHKLKACIFYLTQSNFNLYDFEYLKFKSDIEALKKDSSKYVLRPAEDSNSVDSIICFLVDGDSVSYEHLLDYKIKIIRDTLRSVKMGRKYTYVTNFVNDNQEWYSSLSESLFLKDYNQALNKLFANNYWHNSNIYEHYQYPVCNLSLALFDTVSFNDVGAIEYILKAHLDEPSGSEDSLVFETEKQKALDYVNSKPIKELTYRIHNLLDK